MRVGALLLSWLMTSVAQAQSAPADLRCAVDPVTDAHQCFREREVHVDGQEREAPLYMGGPKSVRSSGKFVHADCAAQVLRLKSRDGTTLAGAAFDATAMSSQLSRQLCVVTASAKRAR